MKKNDPIYLDQNGYNDLLKRIKALKESVRKNNIGRYATFNDETGVDALSLGFEEIEQTDVRLRSELQNIYEYLQRIVLITKHNNQDLVDIGDTIVADVVFSPNEKEEMTFKLVGSISNPETGIQEISVNSPLGQSVYKKKIGDVCSYSVLKNNVSVLLKEKLVSTKSDEVVKQKVKK